MKIPKECYEEYGKDLDGCSTQELEGCGRCILANPKVVSRAKWTPIEARGKFLGVEGPWPSAAIKTDDFPAYLDESNRAKAACRMTIEEARKVLKDWVRLDLEALDGDTESDYAKFVITKIEAIEVVLDTVETLEEDCKWYNDTFVRID